MNSLLFIHYRFTVNQNRKEMIIEYYIITNEKCIQFNKLYKKIEKVHQFCIYDVGNRNSKSK